MRVVEWNSLRTHLIWAYEGAPVYRSLTGSEHASTIAWLILTGSVDLRGAKSGRVRATAGHWVFPAADKASHDFSEDSHIISLRFKAHWPNNAPLFRDGKTVVCASAEFPRLTTAARQLVRVTSTATGKTGAGIDLLPQTVDLPLFLRLERGLALWLEVYADAMRAMGVPTTPVGTHDERVAQVQATIDALPMHDELDEVKLAKGIDLSVSQMNRLFVAGVGMTVRAYADRRRLNAARTALVADDSSVKEIAYRLGFAQPSHFSAWFHKKMGTYPTDYRNMSVDNTRALG